MERVSRAGGGVSPRTAPGYITATRMEPHGTEKTHALARKRTPPAVLIVGPKAQLIYINEAARRILEGLGGSHAGLERRDMALPGVIRRIYTGYALETKHSPSDADCQIMMVHNAIQSGETYLFRAVPLARKADGKTNGLDTGQLLVLIEKVSQSIRVDKIFHASKLTQREQSVAEQIVRGKTNKEIGTALYISEHTVKDHLKHIMGKLKVDTRSAIVAKILQSQ